MLKLTLLSLIGLLGHSVAAADKPSPSPTVSAWIPGFEDQTKLDVKGKVLGVKDSTTTLDVCINFVEDPEQECLMQIFGGEPITFASDMFRHTQTVGTTLSQTVSCSLDGTKSAVCTANGGRMETEGFNSVSITQTITGTDFKFYPVTITAGAEKLADSTATPTEKGESSAASTDAEATTSTGGMPKMTSVPRWAVVGGGAMVGAALAM